MEDNYFTILWFYFILFLYIKFLHKYQSWLCCDFYIYIFGHCAVMCLVTQLCPALCDPTDCSPPDSSVLGDSPGKNTGVGFYALFQGILPTQESNPVLPHCRQILYSLNHQGSCHLMFVSLFFLWELVTFSGFFVCQVILDYILDIYTGIRL